MGRRVTTGQAGTPTFEKIRFSGNTITTTTGVTAANTNLVIDPSGTGITSFVGQVQVTAGSGVRLYDSTGNYYTDLLPPTSATGNRTIRFPVAAPTANYFLQSDASGNCTWAQPTVSVTNDNSTASSYYPLLTSATTDTGISATYRSSTGLAYVPSTGTLTTTASVTGTVTGGTTSGGNLVLRSTTNATKGQVYIDETTSSGSYTQGALRVGGGVGIAGAVYTNSNMSINGTLGGVTTLTCTTLTETSSIAFKENVTPLTGALDAILQLNGKVYDRKDGSYKGETGLIAEEVANIIPNVVGKDDQGKPYSIHYTKLVAYLVESIKSLKEEINELKSR